MAETKLAVTLTRSPSGRPAKHKVTLRTLGLTKMHKTVEHPDNPAIRGMIRQVCHLVEVRELNPST